MVISNLVIECTTDKSKGPGKRGHIVVDTLLPVMFLGLCKLRNICCGHKMFLNKITNIFCVLDTKFVRFTKIFLIQSVLLFFCSEFFVASVHFHQECNLKVHYFLCCKPVWFHFFYFCKSTLSLKCT